jgi:WD40 repeat protein
MLLYSNWSADEPVVEFAQPASDNHTDGVRDLLWWNSQQLLSASYDRHISCWQVSLDSRTMTRQFSFVAHSGMIFTIALHRADNLLLSGGADNAVVVRDGGLLRFFVGVRAMGVSLGC